MVSPIELLEDLKGIGVVKGGKGFSYPSKRSLQLLDPQDRLDAEAAFQKAQTALLDLAEVLVRIGPPSESGAEEMLAFLRQYVALMERELGLDRSAEQAESVLQAKIALQTAQEAVYEAQRRLRHRGVDSD